MYKQQNKSLLWCLSLYSCFFFLNLTDAIKYHDICNWHFHADKLQNIYDKYNKVIIENKTKDYEELTEYQEDKRALELGGQRKKSDCNDLNSFNAVRSFWNLKIKSLCTENTSILDISVLRKICSKTYEIPHLVLEGVKIGNALVNLEFVCAHFLYDNDKEIIKCIKKNVLKNHLDAYHIAFDLHVSKRMLKVYSAVENELNLKELKSLSLHKNIIDDSLCKIHSDVYNIMNEEEYLLLKTLMGLCTKLGFHKQFIMTDNIHPLFNPLASKMPYSFNSLNLTLENTSMYYTKFEYFLYSAKFTEIDFSINTSLSPVVLRLANNNSYVSWVGFPHDDPQLYKRKFDELYEMLKGIDYIERINFCYTKYTFNFYEANKNYFQKYLNQNERQELKANQNIYIFIINSICKNIPNVHRCVEKIITLNGIYDAFFKNFMVNFIYYNSSCIFNCSHVDVGKIFNDDHLWKLFIKYFTHSYLVNYKKKKDNNENVPVVADGKTSLEYKDLVKSYYTNYDYKYIHSGNWRKDMQNINEEEVLKYSSSNIEYEFYNYTFNLIDLNTYSFFILKNEVQEDSICKIASFIQENGKKYVHTNKYIEDFFKNSGRRLSDEDIGENNNKLDLGEDGGNEGGEKGNANENTSNNINAEKKDGQGGLGYLDSFLDDFKDGNVLNMFKNNDFLKNGKLLEYFMKHAGGHHGEDDDSNVFDSYDDYDDEEDEYDEHGHFGHDTSFNIENFKFETKKETLYPFEKQYDYKSLLRVYQMHPTFKESDKQLRRKFFRQSKFHEPVFFQINNIPTKIPNFYKHYYEIKKKKKILSKYEEKHYKKLIEKLKDDPDIFSKMNISFECSKSGKWPVRNMGGNWISDVLCESYYVPQMVIKHDHEEQEIDESKKEKNEKQQNGKKTKNKKEQTNKANISDDSQKYIIKENTRLIGIEFEEQEPYRCVISYLADETNKTTVPISAATVLQAAVGFCILHGFKIVWLADSAFDPYTDIYLKFTSVLEKGKTYYELLNFQLYGQTRLVPKIEYIASGINLKNDIVTSAVFKNKYSVIGFPGTDLQFLVYMSKRVQNIIYNLKFDCHQWAYKGCSEYYPLMKKIKLHPSDKNNFRIILPDNINSDENGYLENGKEAEKKKEEMYKCAFMHDETFIEINNMFPKECTFGSRIGDCHNKIRKEIPCYDKKSCKYLIYLYEKFYSPLNHLNLLYEHFIKISEKLSRLAKPYYLQSIVSLEHDKQIKKYNKQNTEYEEILLFILKNSIFYISWNASSEFWKRAIYVQDSASTDDFTPSDATKASQGTNTTEGKLQLHNPERTQLFCPVAYAHEFIKHMFNQYMKFPNM